METINKIIEVSNRYNDLKRQVDEVWAEMKTVCNNIDIEEYRKLSYEECKDISERVSYRIEDDIQAKLNVILTQKKEDKYPELLQAHYYSELNALDISDGDKASIDNFIRKHIRHVFTNNLISKCQPLLDNIYKLVEFDILKKNYSLKCNECGSATAVFTEDEMNGYKRIWELELLSKTERLTDELEVELDELFKKYSYGCIELCCFDCDEMHVEIANLEQFNKYVNDGYVEIYYKLIKTPDLTYEKL
jgi:hypothetical protein